MKTVPLYSFLFLFRFPASVRRFAFLFMLLSLLLPVFCLAQYPASLNQLHQNVMDDIMASPANMEQTGKLLDDLQPNGAWPDIDYANKERGGWLPARHLSNLLEIAKAWQTKGSKYDHKKPVLDKFSKALDYWLTNDFQCPNWWYPEIGVPMILGPVLLVMEQELSPQQISLGVKILDRAKIGMTGQNKVWLSGNVLLKSLLLKDEETIRKAAASIQEELVVSTKEGVQPDWSYHQHGPQIQFGNYGLAYVGDMIKWIQILRNTPFSFDETKVAILRNYLLEGLRWVTWKDRMDISSCGRQLFPDSPAQKARSVASALQKMQQLDPQNASLYRQAADDTTLNGNRHYWRSDYQIQRTPAYFFSLKMSSERVIGAESCNAENIQGYYMGDGATFLYLSAREYENIFPFWDWKKVPGTTVRQDERVLPVLTASGYRIPTSFTGGVSDGKNGIAALNYQREGVNARKAWFCFDDQIVCIGSGIKASGKGNITTSVNQSFFSNKAGEPVVKQKDGSYQWILHDGIGYYFPAGGKLVLKTDTVTGAWNLTTSRLSKETMKARLFRLWFDHGENPDGESYQYVLIPNAGRQQMEKLEKAFPFRIVNQAFRQEVLSTDGNLAGIVFYEAGRSEAFGGIVADQPCLVMLKKEGSKTRLAVSDPTQKLSQINLAIAGKKVNIPLPQGPEAGKTVTIENDSDFGIHPDNPATL